MSDLDALLGASSLAGDDEINEYMRFTDNKGTTVIDVSKDTSIISNIAIRVSGDLIIRGVAGCTLTVESTGDLQPAIGCETSTGMSYGRWSRSDNKPLDSITIDGIRVICKSKVPNFTLGSYGSSDIPNISLINGGSLECPETTGERVLFRNAFPPAGSTKISERCEYRIKTRDIRSLFTDDEMSQLNKLTMYGFSTNDIRLPITFDNIPVAEEVLSLNRDLDVSGILSSDREHWYIYRCANILQMGNDVSMDESWFELQEKYGWILNTFFGISIDDAKASGSYSMLEACYSAIVWLNNYGYQSDYMKEVMYELIPSYFFSIDKSKDHYSNALDFIADCESNNIVLRTSEIEARRSIVSWYYCV